MSSTLRVEPYTDYRVPALRAFNSRLASGGAAWRFPEDPRPDWLRWTPQTQVFQELFLLLEGETVRGGYVLKHQPVSLNGEIRQMGNLYMPLSEGTINRAYSLVGARLFSDALRRESLLFAVGLGGPDTQVTNLLRALGWEVHPVPFFFRVLNGTRFLRQIRYLQTTRVRRFLFDLGASTGMGWLGARLAGALLSRTPRGCASLRMEVVDSFGDWADELWQRCAAHYSFVAVRTSGILNRIYPPGRPGVFRLCISSAGQVIGYAVIQQEESLHSERMGELRVGTIVDTFAKPEHAAAVVWSAARVLQQRGADVIISNQSHAAWGAALRQAGFREGPSHCVFAAARELAEEIRAVDPGARELHLNRGDGDWPWGVNLRMAEPALVKEAS
jgi:hypothetical protein